MLWKNPTIRLCSLLVTALTIAASGDAPSTSGVASLEKGKYIYAVGEEIVFVLDGSASGASTMRVNLFTNGTLTRTEDVPTKGNPYKFTTSLKAPGWVSASVIPLDEKGKPQPQPKKQPLLPNAIGALVEPEKLMPGVAEPEDFRQFWDACLAELAKVPMKATVKEIPAIQEKRGAFVLKDVRVSCVDDVPVSGYLVMPRNAKPKSLPAVVSYHGAGVSSAKPYYREGAISFDVNAHGIENGQKGPFYADLYKQKLEKYWLMGKESRETFYFKGMYLRAVRALQYVKSLPEWNGKVLVSFGASQGGAQSLAAAALDPDVTLCIADVPAMSDHGATVAGHRAGWPKFYSVKRGVPSDAALAKTVQYFDSNKFAKYIRCPVYLSTGLVDFTCSPTSVYTVYNSLNVEKHLEIIPNGTHNSLSKEAREALKRLLSGN